MPAVREERVSRSHSLSLTRPRTSTTQLSAIDDRDGDQHGYAHAARNHVGQLRRIAGRRSPVELRIEAAHEGLQQGLEDQHADHEVERQQHRAATCTRPDTAP